MELQVVVGWWESPVHFGASGLDSFLVRHRTVEERVNILAHPSATCSATPATWGEPAYGTLLELPTLAADGRICSLVCDRQTPRITMWQPLSVTQLHVPSTLGSPAELFLPTSSTLESGCH